MKVSWYLFNKILSVILRKAINTQRILFTICLLFDIIFAEENDQKKVSFLTEVHIITLEEG